MPPYGGNKEGIWMKTWKHCTLIGIVAIIAFAIAFVTCDNGNDIGSTPKNYIVTFNADNGTANTTQTVTEGNKATKPTNPTKDGYGFVHWFNETTNSEWNFDTAITANLNLKAKWNINQYAVTFNADNGTENAIQTVIEGGMVNEPTPIPTKTNDVAGLYIGTPPTLYILDGWYNGETKWNFAIDTVTANMTLRANWTPPVTIDLTSTNGSNIVEKAVSYVNENSGKTYTLVLGTDISDIEPQILDQDDTIFIITSNSERKVSLGDINGTIFILGGTNSEPHNAKLVIDGYITLQGRMDNDRPLVSVLYGGSFDLKGNAKLTGNSSFAGGGISANGGNSGIDTNGSVTVTMSGNAEISNNTAPSFLGGGGVFTTGSTTFIMSGNATIKNNNSDTVGGGVSLVGNNDVFIMNGGEISDNTATTYGGGVFLNVGSSFIVSSDIVKAGIHNNAAQNGPNVYASPASGGFPAGKFMVGEVEAENF
jgi:uncharacterized repeat protein (TIGR02543 family)